MYAKRGDVIVAVWRDEDDVDMTPELFKRVCDAHAKTGRVLGPKDVQDLAAIGERTN